VLSRIFEPKRGEVTGGGGENCNNEQVRYLYSSPSIIRIIKSRRMKGGHVARMGERQLRVGYWWESQRERDH
jgi:hypothetical protein